MAATTVDRETEREAERVEAVRGYFGTFDDAMFRMPLPPTEDYPRGLRGGHLLPAYSHPPYVLVQASCRREADRIREGMVQVALVRFDGCYLHLDPGTLHSEKNYQHSLLLPREWLKPLGEALLAAHEALAANPDPE